MLLDFALEYRKAIEQFTGARENNLRDLELSEEEWELAKHLRDVLEVSPWR